MLWAAAAGADVKLLSKPELAALLRETPPCCVVDARAEARRRAHPLADALVYRSDLKINPTATVIVVADADPAASRTARAIEKTHPGKLVVAVKGGFPVWESILIDQEVQAGNVQGSRSFVIPRNTCEQDAPLQKLLRQAAP